MEIDDRKFAAFIRYYGKRLFEEGGEDAYALAIPLHVWASTPQSVRVIPADTLPVDGVDNPTVVFTAFVEKT